MPRRSSHLVADVSGDAALLVARTALGVTQRTFATMLGVSQDTYRTWEAQRQPTPTEIVARARKFAKTRGLNAPMGLDALGRLLGIHPRTLRQAARTGRLTTTYDTRTFCGRPITRATRAAGETFKRRFYRQHGWWRPQATPPEPWPSIPRNYFSRIIGVRYRLQLTQAELATRIGAANKAVIYQWETCKRRPSPLFWQRVIELERRVAGASADRQRSDDDTP
jgi:DNA-binding transcriptional regulator YiaG